MAETSAICQEFERLRKLIGVEIGPYFIEIEKSLVRKCAETIGSPDPQLQDKLYEQWLKQPLVPAEALSSYLSTNKVNSTLDTRPTKGSGVKRRYIGGELEFYKPLAVDDVISFSVKIADFNLQEGEEQSIRQDQVWQIIEGMENRVMGTLGQEDDKILLISMDTIYKNQREEVVMRGRYIWAFYAI